MDLIKEYGKKELSLMMYRDIKQRKLKREKDLIACLADLGRAKSKRLRKKKIRKM